MIRLEATVKSLAEDNPALWRAVIDSWRHMYRDAEKNLSITGIGFAEFRILTILQEIKSCSMSRLSVELALTQAAITGVVDKLESQGFVGRARNNEDRRVVTISMTSRGKEMLRKALKVHTEFVERSLGSLSREELLQLSSILRKLAKVTGKLTA